MGQRFFLIAGEPSGDVLGASLIQGLKASGVSQDSFTGVGGPLMQAQGLESLLPMDELCVMGLWEVAGQLPRLLRLIQAMVEEIENRAPDVLVTIDLPDFNFQVAKRLKKRGKFKGKIIHYCAPSVWAWRAGRAKKVAKFLDGMMCLFPFEPPYFEKHGLKSGYVGHPLIEIDKSVLQPENFRTQRGIDADAVVVGLFLGSRERELKTLSPVFLQTLEKLREQYPKLVVVCPTLPQLEYDVSKAIEGLSVPTFIETDQRRKWETFAACDIAVAVSGTVGLELAYIGVPHVIGYKAHPVTGYLVKLLLKVKYVHLANILLDEAIVPEFLQGACNPDNLAQGLSVLIDDPAARDAQKAGFLRLEQALVAEGQSPSARAAAFVLQA